MKRENWTKHWWPLSRLGLIAMLGTLLIAVNAFSALAIEPRQESFAASDEATLMATTVAVLHWQGGQGAANLDRVSGVAVPNFAVAVAPSVDLNAQEAAANAAATATAVAAEEIAFSVRATVEAQSTMAAATAAAVATQQAETQAAAVAATRAAESTRATATAVARTRAAADATAIAAAVAATMEAESAAASVPTPQTALPHVSPLLLAIVPVLGGLLGIGMWRARREPFILKTSPARA